MRGKQTSPVVTLFDDQLDPYPQLSLYHISLQKTSGNTYKANTAELSFSTNLGSRETKCKKRSTLMINCTPYKECQSGNC